MTGPPDKHKGRRRGRSKKGARAPATTRELSRRALAALRTLGRAIAEAQGHTEPWLTGEGLVIPVRLPEEGGADELLAVMERRVAESIRAQSAFRAGQVYCFLCDEPDCHHASPRDPTATFAGYRPTGKPEWQTFTNLCIARQEPRVDRLFGADPEIIALVQHDDELTDGLLPGFGEGSLTFNVLGQVVLGLLPEHLDPHGPSADRIAVTLQIVETSVSRHGRRLRLNLIGTDMDHIVRAASATEGRGPAESLRRTIRTTRDKLHSIGRSAAAAERRGAEYDVAAAVRPVLVQLRGDAERIFRPGRRRTRHARERHRGGERPTSLAMADAQQAGYDRFLRDHERQTVVVLGPRARAHVFTVEGRHVTSLNLQPGELDRKLERRRWRPLSRGDVDSFRDTIG